MDESNKNSDDLKYEDALIKYSELYQRRKTKSKLELDLDDTKRIYAIYARRSTEDEARQQESVPNQIDVCQKFAAANNYEVVDIVSEEKSAKIAGKRDKYMEMIEIIKSGTSYNSIIAWHPDRLARNMKEAGEILDLLDNDVILDLKFPSFSFTNDAAGKMTLSILFAMAKEFSDKLSADTKRGNNRKVALGKYIGTEKRGYINNSEDYFRVDKNTFGIYKKSWDMYIAGSSQADVIRFLSTHDIKMTENAISLFFQDPFYAGIYGYGNQVVDLRKIDKDFPVMLSPKEFFMAHKQNRVSMGRREESSEFRPFDYLVFCAECNHKMKPSVGRGEHGTRYMRLTCSNKGCKAKRRSEGKTPMAHTIRGFEIVDFTIALIEAMKKNDVGTSYNKMKDAFILARNNDLDSKRTRLIDLKSKRTKYESKRKSISDRLILEQNKSVADHLSDECALISKDIKELTTEVNNLEEIIAETELESTLLFPSNSDFLNFFDNALQVLKSSQDGYLIDQVVKTLVLNFSISDQKIVGYTLQEPFKSYENMDILIGVESLTSYEHSASVGLEALFGIRDVVDKYSKLMADHLSGINVFPLDYKL